MIAIEPNKAAEMRVLGGGRGPGQLLLESCDAPERLRLRLLPAFIHFCPDGKELQAGRGGGG